MLTITDTRQQIVSIMEAQGRQGDGLRVGISRPQLAGFRYTMNLVEEGQESPEDVVVDSGTFKVFVDPQSVPPPSGSNGGIISIVACTAAVSRSTTRILCGPTLWHYGCRN